MKHISLFVLGLILSLSAFSQQQELDKMWSEYDKKINQGYYKEAREILNNIYEYASKHRLEQHQIKSAVHQLALTNWIEENPLHITIPTLDSLIATSQGATKRIFYSIKGEYLKSYAQDYSYTLSSIKQTPNVGNDYSLWSLQDFITHAHQAYQHSLEEPQVTQAIATTTFETIVYNKENAQIRPTLYDLLAQNAYNFYTNTSLDLYFNNDEEIKTEMLLSNRTDFLNWKITTTENLSFTKQSILLLQQWMQTHIDRKDEIALANIDILRLNYFHNKNRSIKYLDQFLNSLNYIKTNTSLSLIKAHADYLEINALYNYAQQTIDSSKIASTLQKVVYLAETHLNNYEDKRYKLLTQNILNDVTRQELSFRIENTIIPNKPALGLITYKNISKVYVRIIPLSQSKWKELQRESIKDKWNSIIQQTPAKNWAIDLNNPHDFQEHSTEFKIDGLPTGEHLIIISSDPTFNWEKAEIEAQLFNVSNLSFIRNDNELYVVDRNNGLPIKGAEVQLYSQVYNRTKRENEKVLKHTFITNEYGRVQINKENIYQSYYLEIKHKNEQYSPNNNYIYISNNNLNLYTSKIVNFYTDRSIYRPGQTIHFKAILQQRQQHSKPELLSNYKDTFELRDVNNQLIQYLILTSNEFGSVQGSFILPEKTITGEFTIHAKNLQQSHYVLVEEYKRPTFSVIINKPEQEIALKDTVSIKGVAQAYSGNAINNAKVRYTVIRSIQFPYWRYNYGLRPYLPQKTEVITTGIAETNEAGEFIISFVAQAPDDEIGRDKPIYSFQINADITDIQGETRSGNTSINITEEGFLLKPEGNTTILENNLKEILLNSVSANDEFVETKVDVKIEKLKSNNKVYRSKLWSTPDQFTMSEAEYTALFPDDVYYRENDPAVWPSKNIVAQFTDLTRKDKTINWPMKKLHKGFYKITYTSTDHKGNRIETIQFIEVIDPTKTNQTIHSTQNKFEFNPNEKIEYNILTGYNKVWMIETIYLNNKKKEVNYHLVSSDNPLSKSILVKEENRGGISINYAFVYNNRMYQTSSHNEVPHNNMLEVGISSWRDKSQPGEEQTVNITIPSLKNGKAEILIGMYDISLDQFREHKWHDLRNQFPTNNNSTYWNENNFNILSSNTLNEIYSGENPDEIKIPTLISIDYPFVNSTIQPPPITYGIQQLKLTTSAYKREVMPDGDGIIEANALGKEKTRRNKNEDLESLPITSHDGSNETPLRRNFEETAFFYPQLETDENGHLKVHFKTPQSTTTWKWMLLAHDKDLRSAYLEKTLITTLPLISQIQLPRMVREGDRLEIPVRISNTTDSVLNGQVKLSFANALTDISVDGWIQNVFPFQHFSVEPNQNTVVHFPIQIPTQFVEGLKIRVQLVSGDGKYKDGEEHILAVLPNKIFVSESIPFAITEEKSKTLSLPNLSKTENSSSIEHLSYTIDINTNPMWNVVMALPYLMKEEHESSDEIFTRFYANTFALYLMNNSPELRQLMETWKAGVTSDSLGMLLKNPELKNILLSETPWLVDAQDEKAQRKYIAELFDNDHAKIAQLETIKLLNERQLPNGGFSWFPNGTASTYITNQILIGFGKLRQAKLLPKDQTVDQLIDNALKFSDEMFLKDYEWWLKNNKNKTITPGLNTTQYLYMRSFFGAPKDKKTLEAFNKHISALIQKGKQLSIHDRGMAVIVLKRNGEMKAAESLLKSLTQSSIQDAKKGMYWKSLYTNRYHSNSSSVETMALMLEAYKEINNDQKSIQLLQLWLLLNKQRQHWNTNKTTADACYVLLTSPHLVLQPFTDVVVSTGNFTFHTAQNKEAASGYFKTSVPVTSIDANLGSITITPVKVEKNMLITGGVHWQYLQAADKIQGSSGPLAVERKYYITPFGSKENTMIPVNENDEIKVGDKITVRLIIRAEDNMDYVHLKDMRVAGMEPTNVISGYNYQPNMYYYQSTKDVATHFYIENLQKGTHILEYTLHATHKGVFQTGISQIQCLYAPQYNAHSEGSIIQIAEAD